jgi:hypothetical protein
MFNPTAGLAAGHQSDDCCIFEPHSGVFMPAHGIQGIEIVFLLLLLFVVVFGALARKLAIPYPIVMVIGGLLLSFMPGMPKITLNPDLVFFVILPPLLYSAAWLKLGNA